MGDAVLRQPQPGCRWGTTTGDGITNIQEFFDGTNPTVRETLYWIAQSGNFNTAANWNINRIPSVGDTAVINSGTFTLPTNFTNTATNVTVNVPFTAAAGSNYTLNISGIWTFNGAVTLTSGTQFAVTGGGTATVAGVTSLNGVNLLADNGSTLSFLNVTSYAVPAGLSVQWITQHSSTLSFPGLTTMTGPTTPNTYLDLEAYGYNGTSTLSLPALTSITKADDGDGYNDSGVRFTAQSAGVISAPNLATFNDNDSHPNSSLTAYDTSAILLPKLLAPVGINNINLNAPSNPQQFTSLVGTSSFEINSGTVSMGNLNSITGLSYITADGGAQLSFPTVTSYAVTTGSNVQWLAQHGGSTLSFPNLTSIAGPNTPNIYLNLYAQYTDQGTGTGASPTLSLPALTTITKADDGDQYNDSGVALDAYSGGTISAPNLATFNDNDSHPNSTLNASNAGMLSLPKLLAPRGVNINLNAQSNPQQFTSLVGTSSFEINGGTVVMSKLASISGFSSITAEQGGQLSFPNVTSYAVPSGMSVQWLVQHGGSTLAFPNLTSIAGPTTPNTYLNLTAQYADQGTGTGASPTLSLPALTTITKADDGDQYNDSGVGLYAYSNGVISAPDLNTFDDNDSHPNSSLNAANNGSIVLTSLALSGIRGVTLNGLTLPATISSIPIVNVLKAGGNIKLTIQTLTGHTYQLQQTSSLNPANWQNVGSSQSGSGGSLDFNATTQGTAQFFRIAISPWP